MDIPDNIYQVLIGSLLGDGSIKAEKRTSGLSCRYSEAHSIDQAPYLRLKYALFSGLFGGSISKKLSRKTSEGEGYYNSKAQVEYTSGRRPFFIKFRERWYPSGKKKLNIEDLEKLEPLGLSVWYQDDGYYNYWDLHCGLCIQGFRAQAEIIKKWFEKRWGLSSWLCRSSVLVFKRKDSNKFLRLIVPYAHPAMHYKFGHLFESNRSKLEVGVEKKRKNRREWGSQIYQHTKARLERDPEFANAYRIKVNRWARNWRVNNKDKVREINKRNRQRTKVRLESDLEFRKRYLAELRERQIRYRARKKSNILKLQSPSHLGVNET